MDSLGKTNSQDHSVFKATVAYTALAHDDATERWPSS